MWVYVLKQTRKLINVRVMMSLGKVHIVQNFYAFIGTVVIFISMLYNKRRKIERL